MRAPPDFPPVLPTWKRRKPAQTPCPKDRNICRENRRPPGFSGERYTPPQTPEMQASKTEREDISARICSRRKKFPQARESQNTERPSAKPRPPSHTSAVVPLCHRRPPRSPRLRPSRPSPLFSCGNTPPQQTAIRPITMRPEDRRKEVSFPEKTTRKGQRKDSPLWPPRKPENCSKNRRRAHL